MFRVPVEISARHLHLCQPHLEKLFGKGYKLKPTKWLSQRGQFAAQEQVILRTKKSEIKRVRVVGPLRPKTQVEISLTDARKLAISPPVRASGHLKGSARVILIGPKGKVNLKEGVIIALRHIHINPNQAKKWGLKPGQFVSVKMAGKRGITFHQVYIHVKPEFTLRFCLDTDEGNAVGLKGRGWGIVIPHKVRKL